MKFHNNRIAIIITVLMLLITVKAAMADSSNLGASINLINTPPILTTNPYVNNSNPYTYDTLLCINGTYYDLNNNTEGGRQTSWRNNGVLVGTGYTLDLTTITRAHFDNMTCEQRVNDTYNWSLLYASNPVTLRNNIPTISNLTISPTATKLTPVICNWTYYDLDSDLQTNTKVEWYINNVLVLTDNSNVSTDTLSTSYFVKHNNISCKVYAADIYNLSTTAVQSSTLTVSNSAPTITSTTLSPDPSYKSSLLNCILNNRQDIDGDSLTNYYIFRNGSNILQSSTTSTYSCLTNSECIKGMTITCDGYVYDGEANSSIQSDTSSVLNTIPEAQSVIITPYVPFNTSDLTCNYNYYDLDNDTQSAVYYKWYQNNTLTSFTSAMISYHNTSMNQTWKCGIIVNDGQANSTETISTTVTIGGQNPMIIIIQPIGTVDEGSSITIRWNWTSLLFPTASPYTHYLCGSNNFTATGCGGTNICTFQTDGQGVCNYTVDGSLPTSNDFYLRIVDGLNRSSQVEPLPWTLNHKPTSTSLNYSVQASDNYNTYTCALNNISDIDGDTLYRLYQFQDSPVSILQSYSTTNTFIISTGVAVHGGNITCKAKVFDGRTYSSELSRVDHISIFNPSYTSPRIVDEFMTISTEASPSINSINLSIKSPVNVLYSGLTMTYNNATNKWEFTFAPFAVGNWYIQDMKGASANQSYLYMGQNDVFVVASAGGGGGGGGGGSPQKVIETVIIQNVTTVGCGNKICEEGENPLTCQADCSINYDSLVTCIVKPDMPCNWKQSWFPVALIVGVLLTLGLVSLRAASVGAKVKRR